MSAKKHPFKIISWSTTEQLTEHRGRPQVKTCWGLKVVEINGFH